MRIHHLALRTTDLARLEAFYTGALGLDVVARSGERSVWLAAGDARVMLERRESGEPAIPADSMELVAFAAPSTDDVEARLLRAGVAIEARTSYTIYFRDPDGRRVGVSTYAFEITRSEPRTTP